MNKEQLCSAIMFAGVALFIICMPLGMFFFSASAIICCVGVVAAVLLLGPRSLAVVEFPFRWLLLTFILWLGVKAVWSLDPQTGISVFKNAIYKGFIFFVVGMEISRKRTLFMALPFLFLIVALYQGLDGIWQFYTGEDFINNDPLLDGRLTGSFSTYRVGNFIAMATIPVLALPWVFKSEHKKRLWGALTALFLIPPIFLLIFSLTRSGYICFIVALCALFIVWRGFSWKIPISLAAIIISLMIFNPTRFSIDVLTSDGRTELWEFALEIFKTYPIAGSGLYTFSTAFQSLGLTPLINAPTISHPHNIYLQLLCETGLIGFGLFCALLFGMLVWGGKILYARLRSDENRSYWVVAAMFWATGVGYAAMGFTAHDLLRGWWFGLAWLQLGLMCGACQYKESRVAGGTLSQEA